MKISQCLERIQKDLDESSDEIHAYVYNMVPARQSAPQSTKWLYLSFLSGS